MDAEAGVLQFLLQLLTNTYSLNEDVFNILDTLCNVTATRHLVGRVIDTVSIAESTLTWVLQRAIRLQRRVLIDELENHPRVKTTGKQLCAAAEQNDKHLVRRLLDHGRIADSCSNYHFQAFKGAIGGNHRDLLQWMLANDHLDPVEGRALETAVRLSRIDMVKVLWSDSRVVLNDDDVLYCAIAQNDEEMTAYLLDHTLHDATRSLIKFVTEECRAGIKAALVALANVRTDVFRVLEAVVSTDHPLALFVVSEIMKRHLPLPAYLESNPRLCVPWSKGSDLKMILQKSAK